MKKKTIVILALAVMLLSSFKLNTGFPCHPLGDLGPCTHVVHSLGDLGPCTHTYWYNGVLCREHVNDIYPCSHRVHVNDVYECTHICW
jgi:hypothetical protein